MPGYTYNPDETPQGSPQQYVAPGGEVVGVTPEQLAEYARYHPGLAEPDPFEVVQRGEQLDALRRTQEQFGGTGGEIRAGAEGALSGITLGGYDVLAHALGLDTEKYAQANPRARLGGELAGLLGSAAIPGLGEGALGKLAVGNVAGAVTAGARGVGAAIGGGLKGAIAGAAIEGAGFAAAQSLSQAIISDQPFTAEVVVSDVLHDALWGGAIGAGTMGVFGGLGKLGNRALRGAEGAAAALNIRGEAGQRVAHAIGDSANELDLVVNDAALKAERGLGWAKSLTPAETTTFTNLDRDLRGWRTWRAGSSERELRRRPCRAASPS
jgi:hypothetical protein